LSSGLRVSEVWRQRDPAAAEQLLKSFAGPLLLVKPLRQCGHVLLESIHPGRGGRGDETVFQPGRLVSKTQWCRGVKHNRIGDSLSLFGGAIGFNHSQDLQIILVAALLNFFSPEGVPLILLEERASGRSRTQTCHFPSLHALSLPPAGQPGAGGA